MQTDSSVSPRPITVGIVGAGANTIERHLPGLRAIPGVELLGVCNRSRASSQRVAAAAGIPVVYERWEQAVDDPRTNAIMIGTWPYLHCPVTLAALRAGKHVLTEARMAMNLTEARAMLAASRAAPHLVAQIVPAPHTLAEDATIRRLIDSGYVGRPLLVEYRGRTPFLDRQAPLHWRQDPMLSGENIMGMGIRYEGLMRWVGPAARVMALGRVFTAARRAPDGSERRIEIPEHLDIAGDLASGAQLHLQESAVTPFNEGEGYWIFGDEGVLHHGTAGLRGGRRGEAALRPVEIPAHERIGWRVEAEFVGAIRGEEPVRRTTFEDGVRYMAFTDAVQRSLRSGAAAEVTGGT
jgi:predicted dehydrogenase